MPTSFAGSSVVEKLGFAFTLRETSSIRSHNTGFTLCFVHTFDAGMLASLAHFRRIFKESGFAKTCIIFDSRIQKIINTRFTLSWRSASFAGMGAAFTQFRGGVFEESVSAGAGGFFSDIVSS